LLTDQLRNQVDERWWKMVKEHGKETKGSAAVAAAALASASLVIFPVAAVSDLAHFITSSQPRAFFSLIAHARVRLSCI
jgi:hypothetical protein